MDAINGEKEDVVLSTEFDDSANAWDITLIDLKAVKLPGPVEKYIWEIFFNSNSFVHSFKILKIPSILLSKIFFF